MYSGSRPLMVFGLTFLACLLGPGAPVSEAQQQPIRIESVFPRQLPRGRSTVISVAVPSRDVLQAADILPATDVTVSGIRPGGSGQGALTWWDVTITVANGAAPGSRSLVLVLPTGRTNGLTLTIPNHVPSISGLSIVSAQSNQPTVDLQFTAADQSSDLGDSPYVWFTLDCGAGALETGVVRGKVSGNGLVRASLPKRASAGRGTASAAGKCDLQVRASDANGIDSNTLQTTVEFRN